MYSLSSRLAAAKERRAFTFRSVKPGSSLRICQSIAQIPDQGLADDVDQALLLKRCGIHNLQSVYKVSGGIASRKATRIVMDSAPGKCLIYYLRRADTG